MVMLRLLSKCMTKPQSENSSSAAAAAATNSERYLQSLSPTQVIELSRRLLRPLPAAVPHQPTPHQSAFLLLDSVREVLYGGAAGGGKTDALLMAALQYVDVPNYAALILRRTFGDLAKPGAIMDRAQAWQQETGIGKWSRQGKTWLFPSTNARIVFGYLMYDKDKYQYQGAEFQFIGVDELTQFEERTYRYMFSRLRRTEGMDVPLRMRATSNPGGVGHEWVRDRFVRPLKPARNRVFLPARLRDNPHLNYNEYLESLSELDSVTLAQLLEGDWVAAPEGTLFRRLWFQIVEDWPREANLVRYWDLAASEGGDWLVGTLLAEYMGRYWVVDVRRQRGTPLEVIQLLKQTADIDGVGVPIYIEQEGGSSPLITLDFLRRVTLQGYAVYTDIKRVGKIDRARPMSASAQAGNIKLVRGSWIPDWLEELEMFPHPSYHDDQVDSCSGAFYQLAFAERSQTDHLQQMRVRVGY